MKTFSEFINEELNTSKEKVEVVETKEVDTKEVVVEIEGDKAEYEAFFLKKLKKYGVEEPDELSDEDKKKFFDEIDKEWEGDNEED